MKKTENYITHRRTVYILLCFLIAGLFACNPKSKSGQQISDFDPSKDYFPDKLYIDHAVGFDIVYHKHYKVVHLFRHYNDLVDTVSYALVQKGTPNPEGFDQLHTLQIPLQRVAAVSTTHLGMFEKLEALDQLSAIESKEYISSAKIKALVDEGKITELAASGVLNVEQTIANQTEVLLGVGFPNSQNDRYQELENAGIPVVLNADWQEKDLLGRAEWMKLIAALLNKEALANTVFNQIESEYNTVLAQLEKEVKNAPSTITGIAQGDVWHVVGGKSFAMNVLNLAKVDYPWKSDTSTGSLKLDFETVYQAGLEADYWMTPSNAKTLDEVLLHDTRYADFKSFKNGNIFNVYGRYTEGGGNDYYESAVVNPDIVLKDIVKIFHPELLPNHQLVYYNRLK
uniref:ABC transporter substrate-binding protein n=2 Tax=Roseivirga sp. TaxID=1964215 RepID=UPI004047756D